MFVIVFLIPLKILDTNVLIPFHTLSNIPFTVLKVQQKSLIVFHTVIAIFLIPSHSPLKKSRIPFQTVSNIVFTVLK